MTQELGRSSPIQTDDGSTERQRFGDSIGGLIMEGRVQENPTASHKAQKFLATYAAFKANPVGHAPPTRRAGDALSVGPVSEDP
jgi:hypothetical protein